MEFITSQERKFTETELAKPFNLEPRFDRKGFEDFMLYTATRGASDTFFATDYHALVRLEGRLVPVSTRKLRTADLKQIATFIYGDNAIARLGGGAPIDVRYETRVSKTQILGFRANITSIASMASSGISVTLRTLPDIPMSLADLKIPQDVIDGMNPPNGLICITGTTGSGKSTLLAGQIRYILEELDDHKILTYEKPIEYVYYKIKKKSSTINQIEIGRHLIPDQDPSFDPTKDSEWDFAVTNALRQDPDDIVIGEARDRATIQAVVRAVDTGHTTYTTLHSTQPGQTISKILQMVDARERHAFANTLLDALSIIVSQRLVIGTNNKRCAIMGYMRFDRQTKDKLKEVHYEELARAVDKIVFERGTSMYHHALKRYNAGEIDKATLNVFEFEFGQARTL